MARFQAYHNLMAFRRCSRIGTWQLFLWFSPTDKLVVQSVHDGRP
ncbi:hypothetical protein RchiOBHm_Chr4g0445911 [Rosa chinensis]|uniref:Uncharacterized protein n=1 Tax=Rosa chinensis TaxID=74649 RepID=A0A2P6R4I8_ROSCH|nr:hypothetical protein RchiOBHm_Chr4g0445911 [Rosa chinensis]